ncbi:MAG: hypothetical protein KY396_01500 [Actinobacteria bacterium]|nr:hypothetical protein [Actinomycetota bacterium]
MSRVRRSLEDFFVRNATGLVEDMADWRGERLAGALEALEERSASLAAAEARIEQLERRIARFGPTYGDEKAQVEHLLAELEDRDAELAKLRPAIDELAAKLEAVKSDIAHRDRHLSEQMRRIDAQERWVAELRDRLAEEESARAEAEANLRTLQDA